MLSVYRSHCIVTKGEQPISTSSEFSSNATIIFGPLKTLFILEISYFSGLGSWLPSLRVEETPNSSIVKKLNTRSNGKVFFTFSVLVLFVSPRVCLSLKLACFLFRASRTNKYFAHRKMHSCIVQSDFRRWVSYQVISLSSSNDVRVPLFRRLILYRF